jgi:hypothetical protein
VEGKNGNAWPGLMLISRNPESYRCGGHNYDSDDGGPAPGPSPDGLGCCCNLGAVCGLSTRTVAQNLASVELSSFLSSGGSGAELFR